MKIKNIRKIFEELTFENFMPYYNDMVDQINVVLSKMTLEDNFISYITEITIPATTELEIPHNLKVTPKYRIILRQRGNSLVTDGEASWTDKVIYLKNQGANEVTLTVMIVRS